MPAIDPEALAKAMDLAGMTPAQLAEAVEISSHYMRNITAGHRRLKSNPTLRIRIAKALDVPVHWIEAKP